MSSRVLIADGDAQRGRAIAEACGQRGLVCRVTTHGAAALEAALAEVPDALVCQLGLPLIDAARLAAILRANPRTERVRLVFLADRPGERIDVEPVLDGDPLVATTPPATPTPTPSPSPSLAPSPDETPRPVPAPPPVDVDDDRDDDDDDFDDDFDDD